MDSAMSTQELQLCQFLMELPAQKAYRYTKESEDVLLESLFRFMSGGKDDYLRLFFPNGGPVVDGTVLKLRVAQGAVEGAEYTEAARGMACGHIFKQGEASYSCKTCGVDDTCCLCAKCFDATDHTGHMVRISISPGNSGCCDCGDPEAWKTPMFCTIHSKWEHEQSKGKGKEALGLPEDLLFSIRMTIGRVIDYLCDVISCSPEHLRRTKTVESIQQDEEMSRLKSTYHGGDVRPPGEYAIVLWNDEKHTVVEVRDQVARACRMSTRLALEKAYETDMIGRSILTYDENIDELLRQANTLEHIRVTVTIRSSRDTFREQMCGTIIEWLKDISGCSVGQDHGILRTIVCEELLKPWRMGSPATHAIVGQEGMYDEDKEDQKEDTTLNVYTQFALLQAARLQQAREAARRGIPTRALDESDDDDDSDDDGDGEGDGDNHTPSSQGDMDEDVDDDDEEDVMMLDSGPGAAGGDVNMSDWRADEALEADEATMAGYPPPPPPPAPFVQRRTIRDRDLTPSDSDTAEPLIPSAIYAKNSLDVPKTPGVPSNDQASPPKSGRYWMLAPAAYLESEHVHIAEDLFQRVRLDWMILFDLRMWKKIRNDMRSLYISTVVTIPEFKRILGLRFAGLYTTLAQLYLIGDREPDHSIINLSLQMLTTPSITAEVVERGNFLTSLLAILYTFLTTRQVGHPWNVSETAVLAFDSGSVTNRRMYHFFADLKYLFLSPHVQERLRTEQRYMMQFLDLVKLHQGICPNTRAVGEHVEYETDTWISASLITREINRLCRQFSRSFEKVEDEESISRAIRLAAKAVIVNSIGAERARFTQAEIKDEVRFKTLADFEFDNDGSKYDVVKFVVEEQPISFHHALHYTLSWLIECGKSMPLEQLRAILSFTTQELKGHPRLMGKRVMPRRDHGPEDYLMAAFDFPLRVCAWLAQMKAGMWVRNGMSLRHQAGTYRGVSQRDVSHHRDILLLQTALVVCNPSRVLASIIDRFGMEKWVKGFFEQKSAAQDDAQHLDVVEDMIHLLVILLSDRTSLVRTEDEPNSRILAMRRDITHVLCFKPLSFTEIGNKLPERYQEQEDFTRVLDEMSIYRAPEGVSDVGTFELKPQFVEEVDPYIAHYNKNQREESETAWRKCVAKKTGRSIDDVVYEPKLRPITGGVFANLAGFTSTGMFAQIIYYSLLYPLVCHKLTPAVPYTRVETYLQVVLHLILIAIAEDKAPEEDITQPSFIHAALTQMARSNFMQEAPASKTIVSLLNLMSTKEKLKACHPRIALILKRMRQKRPHDFETAYSKLGVPVDRISTASPASMANAEEEREKKKKAALDRQARVMAQFQQQQKNFLANQADIDWGDVDDLDEDELPAPVEEKNFWKYPSGTCILCQEDTDDRRLYGTFGFIEKSGLLRQTDLSDPDFVREAYNTPKDLDRSAEHIRPFGLAHENRKEVEKVNQKGETFTAERQVIGKGFPPHAVQKGPVSIGCGHIMHYSCFEVYFEATLQRHKQQIARHHPENPDHLEFVCPLCKALGNAFLPIIWKGQEESYPGVLQTPTDVQVSSEAFAVFLKENLSSADSQPLHPESGMAQTQLMFSQYTKGNFLPNLSEKSSHLVMDAWETGSQTPSMSTGWGGATPESSGQSSGTGEGSSTMSDLVLVYRRLCNTLRKNELTGRYTPDTYDRVLTDPSSDLSDSDMLVKAVGFSISAVEVQQRGLDSEYGSLLLEKTPEQALTHLRVLAETVTSYIAVGGQKFGGENRISREFKMESDKQHLQLFVPEGGEALTIHPPLLDQDPFLFFCESTFGVAAANGIEIPYLLRVCYLAEIVRVVYRISKITYPHHDWMSSEGIEDRSLINFAEFCKTVYKMDLEYMPEGADPLEAGGAAIGSSDHGFNQPCFESIADFYTFTKKYAQIFLRKCVILLYVKYGVDFNSHISPQPEQDELDRLTESLRLPDFDSMCAALTPFGIHVGWPGSLCDQLVRGWIRHEKTHLWARTKATDVALRDGPDPAHMLSHPGIFELVGLPKNYDTLIEECTRRRCPRTGKDISDPMICLLCGDVFCGQSICCQAEDDRMQRRQANRRRIGGAQQHMRKCQGNVGLFINIRKCATFYLHRLSGSWSNAPYMDKYGEADMGLRHSRQLFLSQKRYDSMLRALWLGHGVPSFISRKLESDINNGGWETI
ncbi:E3 ubiquitin-protein ligase ubr11 [Cytospora mali]|uniref:E3 ubiquitin-protein ligase n=1 Tax=Cytospora mali TaxID=578113 RepID=A0A194UY95_CYTMA|nr:E3 ubiquitin-protein ligase ubr11 [Valsa mali var. pyri (nom. inval.)]